MGPITRDQIALEAFRLMLAYELKGDVPVESAYPENLAKICHALADALWAGMDSGRHQKARSDAEYAASLKSERPTTKEPDDAT